jgi:hypothetical protein
MSTFNDIDIECAECGEAFRGTVWVAIHAGQDPELKDLLLGGELNLVSCTSCTNVAYQERFLIYQEPLAELIAYVYPEIQKREEADLRALMLSGFHEAQATLPEKQRVDYDPVVFFGLKSLIDQLQKEEALAEQSQVAQAICKQNHIETVLLRPSHARRLGTMRVIPHTGKGNTPPREDILAGIAQLLKIDPVLDAYALLKASIESDPHWSLSERPKNT